MPETRITARLRLNRGRILSSEQSFDERFADIGCFRANFLHRLSLIESEHSAEIVQLPKLAPERNLKILEASGFRVSITSRRHHRVMGILNHSEILVQMSFH